MPLGCALIPEGGRPWARNTARAGAPNGSLGLVGWVSLLGLPVLGPGFRTEADGAGVQGQGLFSVTVGSPTPPQVL